MCTQWRIQDFPWGEGAAGPIPKVGVLTYYFAIFLLKTEWKWKNLDPGRCTPLVPPPLLIEQWVQDNSGDLCDGFTFWNQNQVTWKRSSRGRKQLMIWSEIFPDFFCVKSPFKLYNGSYDCKILLLCNPAPTDVKERLKQWSHKKDSKIF